jgi:hypothetical protein
VTILFSLLSVFCYPPPKHRYLPGITTQKNLTHLILTNVSDVADERSLKFRLLNTRFQVLKAMNISLYLLDCDDMPSFGEYELLKMGAL